MLSSLLILPSLIVTREKISARLRKKSPIPVSVDFQFLGKLGHILSTRPVLFLGLGVLLTGFFLFQALTVTFDYDIMNMEPKGIPSVTLQDEIVDAFQMSTEFALVTTGTIEEARSIAEKAKEVPSISAVASISDYIPSQDQQAARLPYLEYVRENLKNNRAIKAIDEENLPDLVSELERLEMNVYELAQLAYIGGQDRIDRKCKRLIGDPDDSTSTDYILDLADRFLGEPVMAARGLNLFQDKYEPEMRERALNFRKVGTVLITMIPLIFGAVWMVGLLKTIGQQLTLLNVMGIPMIIGIGIDFGVHFMHRYRHEGPGKIRTVVSSTGKAIMITSLTTMAGFGSLLLAKYRGLGSMGLLLGLGVGACFITTIWLLPALLGWIEKRKQ